MAAAVVGADRSGERHPLRGCRRGAVIGAWTLRNSIGIVAIFPLSLLARNAARSKAPGRAPRRNRVPTAAARSSSSCSASSPSSPAGSIFGVNDALPVPFLLLATSVWAGTRFSPWVADLHALLLVTGVVVCTAMDLGPFAEISNPESEVLVVQAYVAVVGRPHPRALGRALREPRPQPATGRRGGRRHRAGDDDAHDPRHDGRRRQRASTAPAVSCSATPPPGTWSATPRLDVEGRVVDAVGYDICYADGTLDVARRRSLRSGP